MSYKKNKKLAEAYDLQSKSKNERCDIKKGNKNRLEIT